MNVTQTQLDAWGAFAEQIRCDSFTIGQLVAAGQTDAAQTLLEAVRHSAILAGLDMEKAGANRPHTLPPKPTEPMTDDELDALINGD